MFARWDFGGINGRTAGFRGERRRSHAVTDRACEKIRIAEKKVDEGRSLAATRLDKLSN